MLVVAMKEALGGAAMGPRLVINDGQKELENQEKQGIYNQILLEIFGNNLEKTQALGIKRD